MSSAPTEIAHAIFSLQLISERERDGQIDREEMDESQMQLLCNWKAQANLTHANAVLWINTANCTGCRPRVTKSQENKILSAHSQMLGGIPTSQKVENRTM
jgi:hypothetical protein